MSNGSKQKKILIVDDEPHILVALEFLIKRAGFEVQKAQSGSEAINILSNFQPNVAILDVMMPGMDGFELAQRIRQTAHLNNTQIIFLTARGTQEDRFKAYETGAEVYLTKPFDNEELITTIKDLIQFG